MEANDTLGQPRALISRSALLHNVKIIRQQLSPGTKVCAVIKADAYGHCAGIVADVLANFACDGVDGPAVDAFAVVSIGEAAAIHQHGLPIYVLRPVENVYVGRQREQFEMAIRSGWVLTVTSAAAAMDIARVAVAMGKRALVQMMIDTGQSREGAPLGDVSAILKTIDAQPSLKLMALCTHFVSSEEPDNAFTHDQLRRFRFATEAYAAANPKVVRHAANSGAIFFAPTTHFDMVRPGIGLYGIDPTCRPSVQRSLRPVLRWTAPLAMVRVIPAGATVGYNQTWRAARETRIGLVPVGYADGYRRAFSNRGWMTVHGRPAPVVGRVSMDYTTIDLTDVPEANLGDEVTVLDSDPLSPASAYALAGLADTIPYEILCHIGQRITRTAAEPAEEDREVEEGVRGNRRIA